MAEGTGCIHGSGVSLQRFQQAAEQSPPRPKSASLTQAALRPPGPLLILQKGEAGDRASVEQLGGRQPFQSGLAETLALSTSFFLFAAWAKWVLFHQCGASSHHYQKICCQGLKSVVLDYNCPRPQWKKYCRTFHLNGAAGCSPPTQGGLLSLKVLEALLYFPRRSYYLFLEQMDKKWQNPASSALPVAEPPLLAPCLPEGPPRHPPGQQGRADSPSAAARCLLHASS